MPRAGRNATAAASNPTQEAKGRAIVLPFVVVRGPDVQRPLALAPGAAYVGCVRCTAVNQRSEPMFNVPPAVVGTVAVLVVVHALRMLVLTDEEDLRFLLTFAFIPAR